MDRSTPPAPPLAEIQTVIGYYQSVQDYHNQKAREAEEQQRILTATFDGERGFRSENISNRHVDSPPGAVTNLASAIIQGDSSSPNLAPQPTQPVQNKVRVLRSKTEEQSLAASIPDFWQKKQSIYQLIHKTIGTRMNAGFIAASLKLDLEETTKILEAYDRKLWFKFLWGKDKINWTASKEYLDIAEQIVPESLDTLERRIAFAEALLPISDFFRDLGIVRAIQMELTDSDQTLTIDYFVSKIVSEDKSLPQQDIEQLISYILKLGLDYYWAEGIDPETYTSLPLAQVS